MTDAVSSTTVLDDYHRDTKSALDAGLAAARFFPFDPLLYLERSAIAGAAVVLSDCAILFQQPYKTSLEFEFLVGWRGGCPGSTNMLKKALRENASIREAHEALAALGIT